MKLNILKEDKNSLDLEIGNLTVAELLRAYLNKQDVKLAVWSRSHPSTNPILHIEADNPRKALRDSIKMIEKEIDKFSSDFEKAIGKK